MASNPTRRQLFRVAGVAGAAASVGAASGLPPAAAEDEESEPPRNGEEPMTKHPFEGFEEVRLGLIGVGLRGGEQLGRWLEVEGCTVTAVCDLEMQRAEEAADAVEDAGQSRPETYGGEDDYLDLVENDDVDLVYVATPWEWHHAQAKSAMENGKHVLVELPIATSMADIWDLVVTSERTRKHCMLAENVSYGQHELRILLMAKAGLFGDLLHGSGGYVHDLRDPYLFGGAYHPEEWRRRWQTHTNASHYPMHGLAPLAAAMDVNRGDRFDRLMSITTPALGLALYREENLPSDHPAWDDDYISGDRNTCFIQTVGGRFIRVEHEVNSPHPYTRANTLVGTRGAWTEDPQRIYLESLGHDDHQWREFEDDFAEYDHWLWEDHDGGGGHGGMDYIMQWRTIQLMRLGLTPDIDVYDSAAWCSVVPLSEKSLDIGSRPVTVPDFTRGYWEEERPGLERDRPDED